MTPKGDELSPASAALLSAIDQAIVGDRPYPDRASFLDADAPPPRGVHRARPDDGRAVVLCYDDGTRRVLNPAGVAPAA